MRIKNLRGRLKGLEVDEPLCPVHVWVGPNGTGKTTRLQLVQWGLLGYVVGEIGRPLDKRVTGVGLLTSGEVSEVELKLSNGKVIRRGAKVQGDATKSRKLKTDTAPKVMEAALSPWSFLDLSQERQREAVFRLLPSGGEVTPERMAEYLKERFQGLKDQFHGKGPVDQLKGLYRDGFDDFVHGGLTGFRDWLSSQRTELSREVNRLKGAAECMSEMSSIPHSEEDFKGASQEREAAWQKLRDSEAGSRSTSRDLDVVQRRFAQVKEELENARRGFANAKAELEEQEVALEGIVSVDVNLDELRKDSLDRLNAQKEAEEVKSAAAAALETVKSRLSVLRSEAESFDEIGDACPTCKRELDAEGRLPALAYFKEKESELVLERQEAEEVFEDALREYRSTVAAAEKAGEAIRAAQSRADQRSVAENAIKLGRERVDGWKERGRALKADLARLKAELEAIEPQKAVLSQEELANLKAVAQAADKRLSDMETARNLARTRRQTQRQLRDAEAALEAAKLLLEWTGPKGLQGVVVSEQLDTLRAAIQAFLGDRERFAFKAMREDGSPWFDFGLERDGAFIPWRALSGGEFTRILSAFLVGMVAQNKKGLRILVMDGLERITQPDRDAFIENLASWVEEDTLDQVLLASSEPVEARLGTPLGAVQFLGG